VVGWVYFSVALFVIFNSHGSVGKGSLIDTLPINGFHRGFSVNLFNLFLSSCGDSRTHLFLILSIFKEFFDDVVCMFAMTYELCDYVGKSSPIVSGDFLSSTIALVLKCGP
jgi:hypothetical protein